MIGRSGSNVSTARQPSAPTLRASSYPDQWALGGSGRVAMVGTDAHPAGPDRGSTHSRGPARGCESCPVQAHAKTAATAGHTNYSARPGHHASSEVRSHAHAVPNPSGHKTIGTSGTPMTAPHGLGLSIRVATVEQAQRTVTQCDAASSTAELGNRA